jgi:hypothetical protein
LPECTGNRIDAELPDFSPRFAGVSCLYFDTAPRAGAEGERANL